MAKKKSIKFNKQTAICLVAIAVILACLVAICFSPVGNAIIASLSQDDSGDNVTPAPAPIIGLGSNVEINGSVVLSNIQFEAHFVDVGQGDAIVLRFSDGNDWIIDAGSGTREKSATTTEYISYLTSIGITEIDYVVATHAHSDHMNMMDNVLDNFVVKNVYYNAEESGAAYFEDFKDNLSAEAGVNVVKFDADGDNYSFTGDNYSIKIYAPGHDRFEDTNYMSPMIMVEVEGVQMLFTGDNEDTVESWFMETYAEEDKDIDVLKVGHHGSAKGTTTEFLQYFNPEFAVISVGMENGYNHPTGNAMDRLYMESVITYRTNRQGNIVLYVDENGQYAFDVEYEFPAENNRDGANDRMLVKEK